MKGLLNLSKQRKETKKPPANLNMNHWPSGKKLDDSEQRYASEEEEDEEDYEPSEQEIIEYAQFIGIDPLRQKNLLHIAREGLITPVPPPWEAIETKGGGQIIYINKQTGQRTYEHPCDELFREIVIQERRKIKPVPTISSQGVMVAPLKPNITQTSAVNHDPLLQLQFQRKKKKQQQQTKHKFLQKKKELQEKYKKQEQQIKDEYMQKQTRIKDEQRREQQEIRQKNRSKATLKEKEDQQKINRELEQFKETMKKQLESTLQQRLKIQKESLTLTYNNKKQQSRRTFEQQYKKKKREAEDDYNNRIKQIENRELEIRKQASQLQKRLNKQVQLAKQDIIQKSLQDHKHRIEQHKIQQEKRLQEQSRRLEQQHAKRLNKLSTEPVISNTVQSFSLQAFIKQLQKTQQSKLKALKYEMDAYKSLRKSEIENQILEYEQELEKQHKKHIKEIQKQSEMRVQNQIKKLEKQIKFKTSQLQKTANDDYLKSLQNYQKAYNRQEGVLVGHYKNSRLLKNQQANQDASALKRLENQYEEVYKQSISLKKQLEKLKLQYETSKQQLEAQENQKGPISRILNEEQRRIYDRLTDMNQRIINERRQLELKQLM